MKNSTLLSLLLAGLLLFSCGEDDDAATDDEICHTWGSMGGVVAAAIVRYDNDPSSSNCKSLQAAYEEFITESGSFVDCEPMTLSEENREEYQEDLAEVVVEFEAALDTLNCN